MHADTRTHRIGALHLCSQILAEMYSLYYSVSRGAGEKNKRERGGGIERKRAGFKCDESCQNHSQANQSLFWKPAGSSHMADVYPLLLLNVPTNLPCFNLTPLLTALSNLFSTGTGSLTQIFQDSMSYVRIRLPCPVPQFTCPFHTVIIYLSTLLFEMQRLCETIIFANINRHS